jgi:hypothetical protein
MRGKHELRLGGQRVGELEVNRGAASRQVDQGRVGEADVDPPGERRDGRVRTLDQAIVADGLDLLELLE